MPQTQFCAEVRIVNMGTKLFSLSIHIHIVGMWLLPKYCQMEKGRERVTMNIVLPLLKWAEASIWLGAKSLVNGCDGVSVSSMSSVRVQGQEKSSQD